MLFKNREDAANKLAAVLKKYKRQKDIIIVALPRGGVVLGRIVAETLGAPLDLVVPRKIGSEYNAEYAIGAITETGEAVWNEGERRAADPEYLKKIIRTECAESARRLKVYRKGLPARILEDKIVIIVDDGIATGLTMRAAVKSVRAANPKKIIVAVPVAPPDAVAELGKAADEVMVLDQPESLGAIGQFYEEFPQVEDGEVIKLMRPQS